MTTTNTPQPEKNFDLYYRGTPILTKTVRAECIGEKNRLIATGSYLKEHFDIKPSSK